MAEVSAKKTWMSLFSAIGFGLVAAMLTILYIKNREAAILATMEGEDTEMMEVVVTNQELLEGTRISEDMLSLLEIPAEIAPDTVLTYNNYEAYLGRFLTHDISPGKPLTMQDLNETYPADFSDIIEEGKRGLTIQVDELSSISGLIRPGNHVDLFVLIETSVAGYQAPLTAASELQSDAASAAVEAATTGQVPEGLGDLDADDLQELVSVQEQPKEIIMPVAQDIRVLATGKEAYENYLDQYQLPQRRMDDTFSAMTLDVDPKQAAMVAMAADKGSIIVTLRNRNDRSLADFDGVTPFDLIKEARKAKRLAELRKAAEAAGATIDENGNWVTADGKVIKGDDIVISENGAVTTKSGQLLGGNGITMNENGEYVDENGNVIDPDDIVVGADGKVTTKQALLEAAGYTRNADGTYTDPDGNIIDPNDIVVGADGKVTTKQALLEAAGYTRNADGTYTDPDGNIIDPDDVQVLANGSVVGPDGKTLAGPKVTRNKHGFLIDENGNVMTADGKILEGVTVDEHGNVIGPDGKIMTDSNLTVGLDGVVRDSSGKVIQGISGSSELPDDEKSLEEKLADILAKQKSIRLIYGGSSKDGKASSVALPVEKLEQEEVEVPVE